MPYMGYVGNLFALTKCPPHPSTLLVTHETIKNQKLVISNQYRLPLHQPEKCQKLTLFSLRGQFKLLRQLFESPISHMRQDLRIGSNSCFSDLSDSLNSVKVLLYLGKNSSGRSIIWQNCCRKLHENERIMSNSLGRPSNF